MTLSIGSSDLEAYENESPLRVVNHAMLEYQRAKRKATLRRAQTSQ